jgi:hypothetical protein
MGSGMRSTKASPEIRIIVSVSPAAVLLRLHAIV